MGINATKYRDRYIKRAARILPAIQPGVPFTPSTIDQIVGGEYSSKFVFYLRELGFEFSQQKDGRKIVSYTLIKEPSDAATIRNSAPSQGRGKNATPKAAKVKVTGKTKIVDNVVTTTIDIEKVKAKNLETMKKVAAKFKKTKAPKKTKKVREFDDVTEQFGTSGEVGTSFNVDRDWDSVEGLDLSKLL